MMKKAGLIPGSPAKQRFGGEIAGPSKTQGVLGAVKNLFKKNTTADRQVKIQEVAVVHKHTHRSGRKRGVFAVLKERIAVFGVRDAARKRDSDAMKFASSNKRTGRKGRRMRRIALYAGSGALVVTVLLVFILAPNGEAASTRAAAYQAKPTAAQTAAQTEARTEAQTPALDTEDRLNTGSFAETQEISDSNELAYTGDMPVPTATQKEDTVLASAPVETTSPDTTTTPIDINDLVKYFRVEADLYYNKMGYSTNHYDYTDNELYMLAQVIDCEARGESFKGKVAVGNVVMNRVLLRGYFGSTISAVITASDQFAYSSSRRPSTESRRAARSVLQDENWVIPQYVYYFHSARPAGVNWGSHKYFTKIGGHCFYTHNYYGRSRVNSVPPALFERTYQWPQLGCKPEDRVYRIQYMLNKLGYGVYADKYFGQDTKDALKEFQEKKGLEADGVAGPSTIKALINAFGLVEYYQKFCV